MRGGIPAEECGSEARGATQEVLGLNEAIKEQENG